MDFFLYCFTVVLCLNIHVLKVKAQDVSLSQDTITFNDLSSSLNGDNNNITVIDGYMFVDGYNVSELVQKVDSSNDQLIVLM